MLKPIMIFCSMLLLTACSTHTRVTDFTDRSLGYGWMNIKDVDANRLHAVKIHQVRPQAPMPYCMGAVKEFKNGFLYYSMELSNGSHKIAYAAGQKCLGFWCGTIYNYSFGKQGDEGVGMTVITRPGVYYLGSYKLKNVKTGFLEDGKFEIVPAADAPSKREMLEEILKDTQDAPEIAERIRRELARL